MAEHRRFADLSYGHVGQLTYVPREYPRDGPGLLHTRRFTTDCPHFRLIGSSAELYPAAKFQVPQGSSRHWQEYRMQKRWLLKSHPEAAMAGSAFGEVLRNDMQRFKDVDATPGNGPMLATGQISDVRVPDRVTGATVLALATGQSGELLHLARLQDSQWKWGQNDDALLNLSIADPEDREDEVTWASDGLPISQIKFATSLTRHDSTRWLIVQKPTSTIMLQPEYHAVPVADTPPEQVILQPPSRIDPNPILTLSHHQTGGHAHSDVAFNANSPGQSSQLIVMDECGYWSVWNILGRKLVGSHTFRLSLHMRGHIWEGRLNESPTVPTMSAEKHGIILVGRTNTHGWNPPVEGDNEDTLAFQSRHALLWNRERFEVFDMETGDFLPRIPNFVAAKRKRDWILDVQRNPVNHDQVFILTNRYIFWIEVSCRSTGIDPSSGPKILLTCPLSAHGNDERMTVCRRPRSDQAMVFIYASRVKQMSVYWFSLSERQLPKWHRHIMTFPDNQDSQPSFDLRCLRLAPARLQLTASPGNGPGTRYVEHDVQYFEGSILGEDLSLRYCIFATCADSSLEITLPTSRVANSEIQQKRRWKKKRRQFLHHMGSAFVLPDGLTDVDMGQLVQRRRGLEDSQPYEEVVAQVPHPVRLKLNRVCLTITDSLYELERQGEVDIAPVLDAVMEALESGVTNGSLPLMTWHEATAETEIPVKVEGSTNDLQAIFDMASDEVIIPQLRREAPKESSDKAISLPDLERYLSGIWIDTVADMLPRQLQQRRRAWVVELARDLFLSSYGVMVQDVPVLGPMNPDAVLDSQRDIPSSSAIPSSATVLSSPPVPRGLTSSPAPAPYSAPDAAFQRLRLLAPSLRSGALGTEKQASVLSYWPTERGVDTADYISSVAAASDKQFDDARARLRRTEAKRKAHTEKYHRPAFMRQGFPAGEKGDEAELKTQPGPAQALSSQLVPPSSQSFGPPLTMSQPVSGVFGDRKKVKKGKRKGGFR